MAAVAALRVVPVACLRDNYAYLLVCEATRSAAAVDCVEPHKVLAAAAAAGVRVTQVLTTHSHWDHAGGNNAMRALLGGAVPVLAGRGDGAEGATVEVGEGDHLHQGLLRVNVISTPCHTAGHVCYYVAGGGAPGVVFTGDTLFVGGSGNLNQGSPGQMYAALSKLAALPGDTRVFCGHNYTERNLVFALDQVEPDNEWMRRKLAEARELNARKEFIPSTIQEERMHNVFVRSGTPEVQAWAGALCQGDPVATLLKVRTAKDVWGKTH